ncbi:PASTA domain-containing protein [Streptomyces sp. AC495_CC817]|uniref:PASTA domain-containing protein n=1 Tax=Streptomyces sp. AC495_CC817 TaxID=2823900 RepID=UPI0020B71AF9|nr:PASTA domain-containing protein [Streptomyces sp. AC495_CC817]
MAGVLVLGGCGESGPSLLAVTAVAAGVPSLAPFFDEGQRLGRDEPDLRSLAPHSGLQQGSTPGLYGGTRKPKVCDVGKLEDFLTDPENKKKAQQWARIVGVGVDRIPDYLDDLTPVLLRHDTLVKNHDYKKGRAVPFDALLEAGIAVLVDDQGLPAVKCSCGNPLRSFAADPDRIKVTFTGDNKEWESYDQAAVVVVKPAPEQLKEIKLVDVEDPDRGISREVGTTGESDTTFDTRARQSVPKVGGMTFGEASAAMAERGLAVTVAGEGMPPSDAPVTGSNPGPGARLEFGAPVALHVDWPGGPSGDGTDGSVSAPGTDGGSGPGGGATTDGGSDSDGGSSGTDPGPTEPSDTGGSSSDGSSSGGSPPGGPPTDDRSTPTDPGTTAAGGGSSPTDDVSSPTGSTPPPPTDETPLTPSPDPTPTSAPTSAAPSTPPPTTPDPDPTPPEESGPPTDIPTSAPDPTGDPPSDGPGDPGNPSDSRPPGDPVQEPARFMWI